MDENEVVTQLRAALKKNVKALSADQVALLVDDYLESLGRLLAFYKQRPLTPGMVAAMIRFYSNLNLEQQVENETDGRAVLTLVAASESLGLGRPS